MAAHLKNEFMEDEKYYRKNPKILDTWKFAVITLKVEKGGFSLK